MNLNWDTKYNLNWYLNHLEPTNDNMFARRILKIILDESRTEEDFSLAKFILNSMEPKTEEHYGYIETLNLYGICYQYGIGVVKNKRRAFEIYELTAHKGSVFAQTNLGFFYMNGIGVAEDTRYAVELYKIAVQNGYAPAQNMLGFCYDSGIGVTKDEKCAVKLYEQAVLQGYAHAQCNLALCYEYGKGGLAKNPKRAVELYEYASQQGCFTAQCKTGTCYMEGFGVAKDEKLAVEYYMRAAYQEDAGAQSNLGFCYFSGQGVTQDQKHGVKLFELAAHRGFFGAQVHLGDCYLHGLGVVKDLKRAVELYELAANQGDANAQNKLALCYYKGLGVSRDLKRAVLLYQNAALQGNDEANNDLIRIIYSESYFPNLDKALGYYNDLAFIKKDVSSLTTLAFCFQIGLGTKQDRKRACELYTQAINQGESCQYDLFTCYLSQYNKGLLDIEVLTEFYSTLQLSIEAGNSKNAALLAYLYERGVPGLDQCLTKAFDYYQASTKENSVIEEYVTDKILFYKKMIDLRSAIRAAPPYNSIIANIIAEYAFEYPR